MDRDLNLQVYFDNLRGGDYKLIDGAFFLESYECYDGFNLNVTIFGVDMQVLNPKVITNILKGLSYNPSSYTYDGVIGRTEVSYYDTLNYFRYNSELDGIQYLQTFESYLNNFFDWENKLIPIAETDAVVDPIYDNLTKKHDLAIKSIRLVVNSFFKNYKRIHGDINIKFKNNDLSKSMLKDFRYFSLVVNQWLKPASNLSEKHKICGAIIQSGRSVIDHFKNTSYFYDVTLKDSKLLNVKFNNNIRIEDLYIVKVYADQHPSNGYDTKYTTFLKNVTLSILISSCDKGIFILDGVKFIKDYSYQPTAIMSWHETIFARNTDFNSTRNDDLQIKHLILADKQTYNSINKVFLSKFQNLVRIDDNENYDSVFARPDIARTVVDGLSNIYKSKKDSDLHTSLHTIENTSELLGYRYIADNKKYKEFDSNLVATLAGLLLK
jgi:hypothetical protein